MRSLQDSSIFYNQIIQLSLNRYKDEGISISPMQVEQIKLMAFNAAVEEQVFFVFRFP